ncbi:hypothetical protein DNTS_007252 [Danionella cerebrum]|uniref:Uncharacterized protein n=1 Tax=Danionella cerebrum TaxID=2873325 RepID=A0A553NRF1_9TELE|nr:hypothetical protein DNTS_007252 [Danionella translucida]
MEMSGTYRDLSCLTPTTEPFRRPQFTSSSSTADEPETQDKTNLNEEISGQVIDFAKLRDVHSPSFLKFIIHLLSKTIQFLIYSRIIQDTTQVQSEELKRLLLLELETRQFPEIVTCTGIFWSYDHVFNTHDLEFCRELEIEEALGGFVESVRIQNPGKGVPFQLLEDWFDMLEIVLHNIDVFLHFL